MALNHPNLVTLCEAGTLMARRPVVHRYIRGLNELFLARDLG